MATTTTRLSLRKPATTDTVNVETDLNDNLDTIDTNTGFQAVTSNPSSPYTGQCIYRADLFKYYVYNGAAWKEFMMVDDFNNIMDPIFEKDTTGDASMTSTSYVATTPNVNTTFTAPASGKIYVTVTAAVEASAGQTGYVSYEVRETNVSGAVVHVAADKPYAVAQQDSFNHMGSTRSLVTGLTAGNTYFIRLMNRTTGGFMQTFCTGLLVEPVL